MAAAALAMPLPGVGSIPPCAGAPQTAGRDSGKPGDQAAREGDEGRAVAALEQLGVPLGRDPSGKVCWIEAANGELSDEAMRHLPSLSTLEWLEVSGGKLSAAGMAPLKGCAALRRLYIHDVGLGKDALSWLTDLRLEALSLQHTGIAGSVLGQLKATSTLAVLNLSENDITDEDLSLVSRFPNLEVLGLQNTQVTGAGLARLKDMAKLNVLNLRNCRIVDADLSHFTTMPNLRIVQAAGCEISEKAVKELTEKLRLLAIFR
jgi:hypothetical protein